jgi:multidrug resistance efflux pump
MSETPRTDREVFDAQQGGGFAPNLKCVSVSFARLLERELAAANAAIEVWQREAQSAQETNDQLKAKLAEAEKDAKRFNKLQNMDPKKAQAFFWNYLSRKQRAKAIDAAIAESKHD